jgi:hypothetical protein
LGLPDTLQEIYNNHAPDWAQAPKINPLVDIGQYLPEFTTKPLVPQIANAAKTAGIIDNPALAPQNAPEEYAAAAARGLGGAALTGPLGGVGALGRTLLAGSLGGIGGEAGEKLFPGSTIAPLVGGALGGLPALGISNLLSGNRIENVAKQYGTSSTVQQAGTELQDAARDWKSNILPMKVGALAAPLDAKMTHNPDVNLNEFDSIVRDMNTKAGKGQPLADLFSSSLPKQVEAKLNRISGPQYTTPSGSTFTIPSLPYEDARAVRTSLGDLMVNPKLIPGGDATIVKKLYAALSQDIGETAKANGAEDEWNAFNAGSSKLYHIGETTMSKIASDTNPAKDKIKPEDAAIGLLNAGKKGGTDLGNVRQEIPYAADELAAAHLRDKPDLWPKLSEEAQSALIPDQAHRKVIDSVADRKPGPMMARATAHGVEAIAGGQVGELLGELSAHTLGLTGIPPEVMRLTGMAAPMVYRGTKNILTDSNKLAYPGVGAVAGNAAGNPLTGQ